ncbi:MAG: hypothetical protein JXB26_07835 [Candidatus Aminicenantes bacterium]|nr:hypothetical protein [Candidatus Aminicenantes bacterium]
MTEFSNAASGRSLPCLYFDEPGRENTLKTLAAAARRVKELDVRHIVAASSQGETALKALDFFRDRNLVIVTHSTGFVKTNYQEMQPAVRENLLRAGVKVLTCQHAFGGVGRAVRKKLGSYQMEEIIAYTLRLFGEGTKVAVEVALMASDAGYIPTGEPCVSIGGTARGADTALLLRPAPAQDFFDIRIMEILVKPRLATV